MLDESLKNYIETSILPLYDDFDAAHQRNHVDMVIELSMAIAQNLNVNEDMVYVIAAYHDTGLAVDRKTHHLVSGKIVREDAWLPDWFTAGEIEISHRLVRIIEHLPTMSREVFMAKSLRRPTAS